jgi:tRNA-dihydrouridine synthase B
MNDLDRLSPHPVMLAPMVGLSHYAVRAALAEFLPLGARALWPTEMLNSRRIPDQCENFCPEVFFYDRANGLCPQILGNEEIPIRRSVKKLIEWGAVAIDINMGCPVNKALKHNYGVALMGDPQYAREITAMAVRASKEFSELSGGIALPVSVKLRAGFGGTAQLTSQGRIEDTPQINKKYITSFIAGLFEAGASWVTVHPRTAEMKRKGRADWGFLKELKLDLRMPIIGNGDVQMLSDVHDLFEIGGVDRVMIGRALMAKPWLLSGLTSEPSREEQGALFGKFLKLVLKYTREKYDEPAGLRRFRFLSVQARPWVEYGEFLVGRVQAARNYSELEENLDIFFRQDQRIMGRTELRQ